MDTPHAVSALSALAQASRLAVFRLLVQHGPRGLTPSSMVEQLGIAAPTLSFHLKELSHAGLISAEQTGRSIAYSVDFPAIRALVAFLYENCCGVGIQDYDPKCAPSSKRARNSKPKGATHEPLSRARRRR